MLIVTQTLMRLQQWSESGPISLKNIRQHSSVNNTHSSELIQTSSDVFWPRFLLFCFTSLSMLSLKLIVAWSNSCSLCWSWKNVQVVFSDYQTLTVQSWTDIEHLIMLSQWALWVDPGHGAHWGGLVSNLSQKKHWEHWDLVTILPHFWTQSSNDSIQLCPVSGIIHHCATSHNSHINFDNQSPTST